MNNAKRPLKTFGKRTILPSAPTTNATKKPSSMDAIYADENDQLQAKIDQLLVEETGVKRPKATAKRNDFMDELDELTSDEEDPLLPDPKSKTVKTVHELVEAGENSRFFDEIEYLVEGLRVGSDKGRLLAFDELIGKIANRPGFGGRMRAHGMLSLAVDNCWSLVGRSAKARECLILLILFLCHDIRKLDVFISMERLCALSLKLINETVDVSTSGLRYLAKTPVFKDFNLTALSSPSLGVWLLAKISQSISQSGSKADLHRAKEFLSALDRTIILFDLEDSELSCLQLRWSLLASAMIQEEGLMGHFSSLVTTFEELLQTGAYKRTQGALALLDLVDNLVQVTGQTEVVLNLPVDYSLSLFTSLQRTLECPDISRSTVNCILSAAINLVESSESLCEELRLRGDLPDLAELFQTIDRSCRSHLGLLLGFLVRSSRANLELFQNHVQVTDLIESIEELREAYKTSPVASQVLESSLFSLIDELRSLSSS